jgi:hypothetical protein
MKWLFVFAASIVGCNETAAIGNRLSKAEATIIESDKRIHSLERTVKALRQQLSNALKVKQTVPAELPRQQAAPEPDYTTEARLIVARLSRMERSAMQRRLAGLMSGQDIPLHELKLLQDHTAGLCDELIGAAVLKIMAASESPPLQWGAKNLSRVQALRVMTDRDGRFLLEPLAEGQALPPRSLEVAMRLIGPHPAIIKQINNPETVQLVSELATAIRRSQAMAQKK